MKLFRSALTVDHQPGIRLRISHRPSLAMCMGFVTSMVLMLSCWLSLRWAAFVASLVFAFPVFMTGTLVWLGWRDVLIPRMGTGTIAWRDGLLTGSIPAESAIAAQVDVSVQPKLHKGPGPTAYVRLWIADKRLSDKPAETGYWRSVMSYEQSPHFDQVIPLAEQVPVIQKALLDLGYPPDIRGSHT